MSYQILMDSCGDLSEGMRNNEHLRMIPLQIRVGQKEWPDDGHINKQELFDEILETDVLPKSACPAPDAYLQKFDKNADRIYVITVSSALSGSYNSASLARKLWREENKGKKGQKIYIIDSKSASAGQTLLAGALMRWENKGYSEDEIRKRIKKLRRDMMTKFVLNDLTMLERSGRLNGLQAKLADAFHICPILASTDEGTICQTGQARGMKRALSAMVRAIGNENKEKKISHIVISHCGQEAGAYEVKKKLNKILPDCQTHIVETGGIASVYAGIGGIILAYA